MKIVEVYVRNEWLAVNTTRQQFRERSPKDLLSVSTKVLKAAPLLAIASAGLGKGMAMPGISLTNFGTHIVKESHTGIGNLGKNNGRFYDEIDMPSQRKFATFASAHPELPISKMWLVINDDQIGEDTIKKGILFYSRTEAKNFAQMYGSLEEYTQSDFYQHKGISVQITEDDLETFDKELYAYLEARDKSLLNTFLKRVEVRDEHFIETYPEEGTSEGATESPIVQIDFPATVTESDYKKYFTCTDLLSACLTVSLAVHELEATFPSKEEPEFKSTNIYEEMAQEADLDSEEDYEKGLEEEKNSEEKYKKITPGGKEKPKSAPVQHSDAEIRPQASGKLTKRGLTSSMEEGFFSKSKEKERTKKEGQEEQVKDKKKNQPGSLHPK